MATIENTKRANVVPGHFGNNINDGGGSMNDKYVTHEELDHAINKISAKIDLMDAHLDTKFEKVNTKFAIQQVWIITTAIALLGAISAILAITGHIK